MFFEPDRPAAGDRRYRQLVEQLDMPMLVHVDGVIVFATEAVAGLLRLEDLSELQGRSLLDVIHPDDLDVVSREMALVAQGLPSRRRRYRVLADDGATVWVEAAATPYLLDGREATLIIAEDVSDRVAADAQLRRLALHDALTGLPNRVLVEDRIQQALELGPAAVVMVDLDRFKDVNDSLGHAAGDAVLVEVAQRMRRAVRAEDTVGRLGGDEFVLVLRAGSSALDASSTVRRLLETLERPIEYGTSRFRLSASLGVSFAPDHGRTADELLRAADAAMYRAKRERSGPAVFDQRDSDRSRERLALSTQLADGIDRDELVLHYQPTYELATGALTGCEALLRWQHPERGLLPPDRFLPLAEETGLVHRITTWVVDRALAQAAAWRQHGHEITVSVNLSPSSLQEPGFVEEVRAALHRHRLGPGVLVLEITEQTVMRDPEAALRVMRRLDEAGVAFSLDDFGTGYSSLTYLRLLPVRELKIDRSFIGDAHGAVDRVIVETIIALSRRLGLRVVAEGIETGSASEYLREAGCHVGQGFHLGRPVPPEQLVFDAAGVPAVDVVRAG